LLSVMGTSAGCGIILATSLTRVATREARSALGSTSPAGCGPRAGHDHHEAM
jgi:hypothetical protein